MMCASEGALVARNQIEAALTPEQKEKLKSVMMAHSMGRQGMGPTHQGPQEELNEAQPRLRSSISAKR